MIDQSKCFKDIVAEEARYSAEVSKYWTRNEYLAAKAAHMRPFYITVIASAVVTGIFSVGLIVLFN